MAKTGAAAPKEENLPVSLDDLYAGFSAEEKAELLGVTGQSNALREKPFNLKINFCDLQDVNGRSIKKGNFVIGQNSSEVEVEVEGEDGEMEKESRATDIGIDLGKSPKITVLTSGQQYSFYHDNPKLRCTSQVVFDRDDVPVGSNLKRECRSKTNPCPRRAEGLDKKEKCSCQHVVYCTVKPDPEGEEKNAILYLKGESYMPFNDYLKSAGLNPVCFFPTKLTTDKKKQGVVDYWVITPILLKDEHYTKEKGLANARLAKQTREDAKEYQEQQAAKNNQRQITSNAKTPEIIGKDDEVGDIAFD